MRFHNNRELFEQTVLEKFNQTNIKREIIEKDYYVTMILKKLSKRLPHLMFKGGTSLSKCFKIINRFSEDIDLTLEDGHLTQGQRQNVKAAIVESCEELGLTILNLDDTRSKREFNRYQIDYPSIFGAEKLKQYVYVETSFMVKSFPSEISLASSLIYDFLNEHGFNDLIAEYELQPYQVRVQSIERTFIDKLFAICDYYLDGRVREHSRHLYDIHKLFPHIKIDGTLKQLMHETRIARQGKAFCPSAAEGVNLQDLLRKVIENETYKQDYKTITEDLLFETVSYEETIETLNRIIKREFWSK
jgi:predicted nucleotidyltransferase component of viral defense system